MFAQADIAYYDRRGAARIPPGKFVRFQHRDDRFHARHRGNRLLAKQRLRPDYANDDARRPTADLCLQPELAYTRDNPLDLFFGGVWLRDYDHIPGSGIIR